MSKASRPDISFAAILRLATPIFIANIAIIGNGMIDSVMAGRLGAEHLATVAVGSATVVMILISLVGVLQSLSPIAGQLYGARKLPRIGFELNQCLWLCVVITILGVSILSMTDFWIGYSHMTGRVADMLRIYLLASACSVPAFVFSRPYVALNAAINRPSVAMWVSLTMLALKMPLNAIFMYGWLGAPALGGAGAGIATAIDGWIAFFMFYGFWKFSHIYDAMRVRAFCAPCWASIREHLHIGLPIALSTFFEISSFTLMAIFIAHIGTIDVAGHQIVANVTTAMYQVPFSLGIAASVLVAQCCGAKELSLAKDAFHRVLGLSVLLASLASALLFVFKDPIAHWYTTDVAVAALASSLLIFGVIYHVLDAVQSVSAFALRGYKVTVLPMIIFGVCLWTVGLGGGSWLAFSAETFGGPFRAYGFWAATGTGLFLCALFLFPLAERVSRQRIFEAEKMRQILRKSL